MTDECVANAIDCNDPVASNHVMKPPEMSNPLTNRSTSESWSTSAAATDHTGPVTVPTTRKTLSSKYGATPKFSYHTTSLVFASCVTTSGSPSPS